MIRIRFHAAPGVWDAYRAPLGEALGALGLKAETSPDIAIEDADYLVYAPAKDKADFSRARKLKAVLSLWAGVETLAGDVPADIPLARMVDPGLTEGMVEYVTGHVLRIHLQMDGFRQDGIWRNSVVPPLARERRIGMLGLGELGLACAEALKALRFDVAGWSRRPKATGFPSFVGNEGLDTLLGRSDIIVSLLPLTAQTESVLNADRLARLPEGAALINPGRGALVDDAALLAALDGGRLSHATLDAFRVEPLPEDDRFWTHPKVTVTPHIASATRPLTAARVVAENVARAEQGLPLLYLVNPVSGY